MHWFSNNPSKSVEKRLIPLSERTRSLKDIQEGDSTKSRMTAMKIIAELYGERVEADLWYFE